MPQRTVGKGHMRSPLTIANEGLLGGSALEKLTWGIKRGCAMQNKENALVGTWKLVSCFMEDVETNEQKFVLGEHPKG